MICCCHQEFDVVGLEFDLKYPKIDWIKDAFEAP
jgi:hypothetical protein